MIFIEHYSVCKINAIHSLFGAQMMKAKKIQKPTFMPGSTVHENNELDPQHDQIHIYETSNKELIFLDITLYKGDRFLNKNILDIRTHIKDTNKQLYVHADSYHPDATKKL